MGASASLTTRHSGRLVWWRHSIVNLDHNGAKRFDVPDMAILIDKLVKWGRGNAHLVGLESTDGNAIKRLIWKIVRRQKNHPGPMNVFRLRADFFPEWRTAMTLFHAFVATTSSISTSCGKSQMHLQCSRCCAEWQ